MPNKKRGLNSTDAREVRRRGHADALEFALLIGLTHDYQNDSRAKKDVIDLSGDAHSVKSGVKKWQIFLYGSSRFQNDPMFAAMNGIGELLYFCINSFPPKYEDYQKNKSVYKEHLRNHMRALATKLQNQNRLKAFLSKSIFNAGEVVYLTIKHNNLFHVFYYTDVLNAMVENLTVLNSKALAKNHYPEQKVILRYHKLNLGEIEMRNDSQVHYREVRFNMIKPRAMELLFSHIPFKHKYNDHVSVYGYAEKKFGRWNT